MPQKESMVIVTLWKEGVSRACHGEKEVEAATAAGFAPYNPSEHQYPRMLYQGPDSIRVNSTGEEAQFIKEGWSRKPSEAFGKTLQQDAPKPAAVPTAPDERVSGLAARLSLAEANIAALEDEASATNGRLAGLAASASKSNDERFGILYDRLAATEKRATSLEGKISELMALVTALTEPTPAATVTKDEPKETKEDKHKKG